ncbi:MAG: ATP-binding protein [Pirellulaceae bacterium]|nr:ATP-binding protein [Pirellulaceae bacterium]
MKPSSQRNKANAERRAVRLLRRLFSLSDRSTLALGLLLSAAIPFVGLYLAYSNQQLARRAALESAIQHTKSLESGRRTFIELADAPTDAPTDSTKQGAQFTATWAERQDHFQTRFVHECPSGRRDVQPPFDSFERAALKTLAANPSSSHHEFERVNGILHVRYAVSTTAGMDCRYCSTTPGAIIVDVPLTTAHQQHSHSLWGVTWLMFGLSACGILVTMFAFRTIRSRDRQAVAANRELSFARQKAENRAREAEVASDAALEMIHQLEVAKEKAAAATHAKSAFLATMSHELRTPMTAILGFSDVLSMDSQLKDASPACRDAVETIARNGEHLLKLINGILDLSKIEADKMDLKISECSPFQIISEATDLLRVHAELKQLQLRCNFTGHLPEQITTDPLRLNQILINLIGNAVKFTESGEIAVTAELVDKPHGRHLLVEVADTGIGIPPDQLEMLFEPFTQVDNSYTREFDGTGLGLTISRRLAELLGGDITVSSTSAGSTFALVIPVADDATLISYDEYFTKRRRAQSRNSGEIPQDALQGMRILLAEDGKDNQKLISFVLKKVGATVEVVENGQLAVDALDPGASGGVQYDLVLMDMHMPVMDGYSATRLLRQNGYSKPIVALTANAMRGDREKCLDAGCDDYAAKPINRRKLVELVRKYSPANETTAVNAD